MSTLVPAKTLRRTEGDNSSVHYYQHDVYRQIRRPDVSWWRHDTRIRFPHHLPFLRGFHQWPGGFPSQRTSDEELLFSFCQLRQLFEQTVESLMIWDIVTLMWRHSNVESSCGALLVDIGITNHSGPIVYSGDLPGRQYIRSIVPEAGIKGNDKLLHSTVSVGCNCLSLPALYRWLSARLQHLLC